MAFMSCDDPATRRRRVEMQGFTGLDDDTLRRLDPWLRLAPGVCMGWAAVGTALGSATVLGSLVPFALAGAIGDRHPFDAIYEHGIRQRLRAPSIPRYGAPRRFACAVATAWLVAAAAAFRAGARPLGYALGVSLVGAASVPTFTGFCIPSWIYGKLPRRQAPALGRPASAEPVSA